MTLDRSGNPQASSAAECKLRPGQPDDCERCLRSVGRLCEFHARQVLPQLSVNVGWLRLMGEAMVEQTKRQSLNTPSPHEASRVAKIGRRNARKVAKSPRRGLYGLLRAIANPQPDQP